MSLSTLIVGAIGFWLGGPWVALGAIIVCAFLVGLED